MTTLEEFEAWLRSETDKGYFWEYESALAGFEASRTAALEEAAKECEKAYSYDPEALVIADKIRALKEN